MPKTLIKSRLHSNKNKTKIKQEINIILNQIYLQIYNHINKTYYQEMVLLNIKNFKNLSSKY